MTSILGKGTQWMEVVVREVLLGCPEREQASNGLLTRGMEEASILHRVESSNITELQSFTEKGLPMGHLHYTPVLLRVPLHPTTTTTLWKNTLMLAMRK